MFQKLLVRFTAMEKEAVNNLAKLRELTNNLPPTLDNSIVWRSKDGTKISYDGDKRPGKSVGKMKGVGLFKNEKVAVQRVFLPKGYRSGWHVHPKSVQVMIIYEGLIRLWVTDKIERTIEPGECALIKAGICHRKLALEDTQIITTIIPAEESFPDGPKT